MGHITSNTSETCFRAVGCTTVVVTILSGSRVQCAYYAASDINAIVENLSDNSITTTYIKGRT